MSSAQGKDFSNWNGRLNRTSLSGLDFAFFKATESTTFIDGEFRNSWAVGKQAGVHRGAYHFFHPSVDPRAQAHIFVDHVKATGDLEPGDMLAADIEIVSGFLKPMLGLTRKPTEHKNNLPLKAVKLSLVDSSAKIFLDTVKSLVPPSNPVLVYTDLSVGSQLRSCTSYPLWIAYPSSTAPKDVFPWTHWTFWQWGQTGVDRDAFNGTAADLQNWIDARIAPARRVVEFIGDGVMTMNQLSHAEATPISSVLRHTLSKSRAGLFTKPMSQYIQAGNWDAPLPKFESVWYSKLVG